MASEITSDGVKIGEILVGAVGESEEMLWVVTRVVGKYKVEAVCATRDLELKIGINTTGINGDDHDFRRARFIPRRSDADEQLGTVVPF